MTKSICDNIPFLSIITPTFNRASLLPNCYQSLQLQTSLDFEWIVVDDGSTDDTCEMVRGFVPTSSGFPITLVEKANGGKHTALNAAHPYIHGKYVLILDSDDTLTESAVEKVKAAWECYASDNMIGIVVFLKGISETRPNCLARDENTPVDIMRYKRTIYLSSDCCEVIRSELFVQYPFPVFAGENFVAEGALWSRTSISHKCIYINQVIYKCTYLQDGLTKSGKALRIRNPRGGIYTANISMNQKNFFGRRVKSGLLFTCYGCFARLSPAQMSAQCDSKALMWACLPFGWVLFHYWQMKYSR